MSASSLTMESLPEDPQSEEDEEERVPCSGFRVKYLGCATFSVRKKRSPKGIASMQRPLLEVYAGARKKGESQRSAHLFALDQRLDVLEYGLVLAQKSPGPVNGSRLRECGRDGEKDLVLVKVLTPLSNAVLWAAVRFQAKALKRRVLGAAFVPLACCDAVLDRKGYLRLDAKHRFLVSLSHPSVFACVFRRVTDPRSFECHAFACGSAREALALGSALTMVRERCDMPPLMRPPWPPPPQPPPQHYVVSAGPSSSSSVSQRRLLPSERRRHGNQLGHRTTESEGDESNSYASVRKFDKKLLGRAVAGRRGGGGDGGGNTSESSSGVRGRRHNPIAMRREPIGAIQSNRTVVANGDWTPVVKSSSQPTLPTSYHVDRNEETNHVNNVSSAAREPSSSGSAITPSDTSCSAEYLKVGKRPCVGGGSRHQRDVWTMTEAEEEKTIDLSSENSIITSISNNSSGGDELYDYDDLSGARLPTAAKEMRPTTRSFEKRPTTTPRTGSAPAPVKYTYFGYETYRAPTWMPKRAPDEEGESNDCNLVGMGHRDQDTSTAVARDRSKAYQKHCIPDRHYASARNGKKKSTAKPANIVGNGTGRITISVPFCKKTNEKSKRLSNGGRSSVASSTQTDDGSSSVVVLLPTRGVRSFRSDRHVGDWSTLSQTTSEEGVPSILRSRQGDAARGGASSSSSSYSVAKTSRHSRQRPRPQKMLRWRSEDRIPPHRSFFWSLKRLSLQSLTKAKHKTGKFISTMRTKLMGSRKSPDGSEDSAYDTAEVCLSPNGKSSYRRSFYADDTVASSKGGTKAHRQQSWSFHDLRTAGLERSTAKVVQRDGVSDEESGGGRSTILLRKLREKQPKRRTRRRRRRQSSASDSGVEEYYPSDASALRRSGSEKTLGMTNKRVTRVEVHHGMSEDTFNRWSHTNIQDELGYIP